MSLPQIDAQERAALKAAETFLFEWVRPQAGEIDQSVEALKGAFEEMAQRGLLGLRVPVSYGGSGWDDRTFRRFQETAARCSGSLAFLQTQHQSACGFLAASKNSDLCGRLLPKLATGERKGGIAFSQLRRPGKPVLAAEPRDGGYVLNGKAPWVTGWGIFDICVTAGTLPDGDSLFTCIELRETKQLRPSPIMRLAAMEVAQTVSAELSDLYVSESDVLYVKPGNWIHESDLLNIALQSPFALGCAQAAIDVMRDAYEKKPVAAILETADALEAELAECREEAYAAMEASKLAQEHGTAKPDQELQARSLRARARAIELAGRCAHAAVAASSGAGNSMQHAAQRVYREALVFTVSAQTSAIMEATLERLRR